MPSKATPIGTTESNRSVAKLPGTYRMTATSGLEHRCCACHEWKPATDQQFVTERKSRFGLGGLCLVCNRKRAASWRKANPSLAAAAAKRRIERNKQAPGTFTAEDREYLFDIYGRHCLRCGRHELICGPLVADHIVPPPVGSHDITNRQPLCGPCNKRKSASTVDYRPQWKNAVARRAA